MDVERRILRFSSAAVIAELYGTADKNIKCIEDEFGVTVSSPANKNAEDGENILVVGGDEKENTVQAEKALNLLAAMIQKNGTLTDQNVSYVISMVRDGKDDELAGFDENCICVTSRGRPIKPKTVGQRRYVDLIRNNTIILGVGPAGTGKTFLAVAMAVKALREKQVDKIILTRPAIEAGEKLGFLPGDLQSKIDPYLRPLYDALGEMMGQENYLHAIEKQTVEVAPLAYMRGRTLDDSFIILDEAQNATFEQMKMFLTRLGNNSKAVVTGDLTQTDLPFGQPSGLKTAVKILDGIDDIAIHRFTESDVVRHRLVQKIILAYDKYEKEMAAKNDQRNGPQRFRRVK